MRADLYFKVSNYIPLNWHNCEPREKQICANSVSNLTREMIETVFKSQLLFDYNYSTIFVTTYQNVLRASFSS